jgi:isopentenyl-diphosphate delta-isomerase
MVDKDERVILVDGLDRRLGTAPKLEAHVRGLRHRAISVILRDAQGRLLLQKRASSKYHSAGLWANSCCGHPRPGERSRLTAERRLYEELRIGADLRLLRKLSYRCVLPNGLVEDELVHIYSGLFSGNPAPCSREVEDWAYVSPAQVRVDMSEQPEQFACWFKLYMDRLAID